MQIFHHSGRIHCLPETPYVLLVDDDESSWRPLAELVRLAGYTSVAAESAADALACCRRRRPDVLVTDLVMPKRDGRDLAIRVRKRFPGLPMVLVTGQNLEHPDWSIPRGLFEQVFAKPLDFDRFIAMITLLMPA